MCHECFQNRAENGSDEEIKDVHVDYPTESLIEETANRMVNQMVDELFPMIWNENKTRLKEMSKKDLAYEMFGAGAYIALSNIMKLQYGQASKEKKNAEKKND